MTDPLAMLSHLSDREKRRYIKRATPMKHHPKQRGLFNDTFSINYRFNIVHPGRRCLAKGTWIHLADGSVKPIEEIVLGDVVWSLNEEYQLGKKIVVNIYENGIQPCVRVSTNRRGLECTFNHRSLVDYEWVEADKIKIKDLIGAIRFLSSGNPLCWERVTRIEDIGQKQTYDLTIEDNHCYIANGVVTHNSGKSEIVGKRRLVARAVTGVKASNPRYFVAAPTRDQVKKIYWNDLKVLTLPYQDPLREPRESDLIIYLKGDREIHLLGMDKPERIEGSHWDGGVLDEYANMKPNTWEEHVRPALSTPGRPPAWCDFVGVPEGRNHYYRLKNYAAAQMVEHGAKSKWAVWHWPSSEILSPEEIELAKSEMDELTFSQEYCGDFINFKGRAYYNFFDHSHCAKLHYNPNSDLIFCFDFNIDPGIAVIVQEQNYVDPKTMVPIIGKECTGVIGEVWIPKNSNTIRVCEKLIEDWGGHQSKVCIYGDSSGGHGGSAKVRGSDWDLVDEVLRPVFGDRLIFRVPRKNPLERSRINAVNSRLKNTLNDIRLQVDPTRAPHVVTDFEGVALIEGGTGNIDKKSDPLLTHCSDAIGYYICQEFPVVRREEVAQKILGF